MSTSGWCSTGYHGSACKWAPCTCYCHDLPALEQIELGKKANAWQK